MKKFDSVRAKKDINNHLKRKAIEVKIKQTLVLSHAHFDDVITDETL